MGEDNDDEIERFVRDLDITPYEIKIVDEENNPHSVQYAGKTPDLSAKKTVSGISFILLDFKGKNFAELDLSDGLFIEMISEFAKFTNQYGTEDLNDTEKNKLKDAVRAFTEVLMN